MNYSKQRTKIYIIKSFLSLLDTTPFPEIKVGDIISTSDVSKSTFYKYFPGKQTILDETFIYFCQSYKELIKEISTQNDDDLKTIANFINGNRESYLRFRKMNSSHFDVTTGIINCWIKNYPEESRIDVACFCLIMNELFIDQIHFNSSTIREKLQSIIQNVQKALNLFSSSN